MQLVLSGLMKHDITTWVLVPKFLWSGCYDCTIVMSYTEINKAVSHKLLTLNLCISATWLLTSAFYISSPHTPEIIDMHRGRVW